MTDFESSIVTSVAGLRTLYAQPIERIAKKQLGHVNEAGRAFIAASPFLVLATASQQGLDCSPKGDQPGFVEVAEDGRTLFIPDRRGNNRIDGLKNLVEDPRIGLIFFVPGVNETYRVNGRARICQDAELKRRFAVNGKEPATVMVVTVEETFQHCAKARCGPTCGRRLVAVALKACQRWVTSWQHGTREWTVSPLMHNTMRTFRASFIK
jgi:uncharacterized protein